MIMFEFRILVSSFWVVVIVVVERSASDANPNNYGYLSSPVRFVLQNQLSLEHLFEIEYIHVLPLATWSMALT